MIDEMSIARSYQENEDVATGVEKKVRDICQQGEEWKEEKDI